jgi:hypothetical protein
VYDILTSFVERYCLIGHRGHFAGLPVHSRHVIFDSGRPIRYGHMATVEARATVLRSGSAAIPKFFNGSCRNSSPAKHPMSTKNDPSKQRGTRTTFVPRPTSQAARGVTAVTRCRFGVYGSPSHGIRPARRGTKPLKKLPLCATQVCLLETHSSLFSGDVAGANCARGRRRESQREIWIRNKIRMVSTSTSRSKTRDDSIGKEGDC